MTSTPKPRPTPAEKGHEAVLQTVEKTALEQATNALREGGPDSVSNAVAWIAWGADSLARMALSFTPATQKQDALSA